MAARSFWRRSRHLWQVGDNLLGNCCKYALSGTRVYPGFVGTGWAGISGGEEYFPGGPQSPAGTWLMEAVCTGRHRPQYGGFGLGLSITRSLADFGAVPSSWILTAISSKRRSRCRLHRRGSPFPRRNRWGIRGGFCEGPEILYLLFIQF